MLDIFVILRDSLMMLEGSRRSVATTECKRPLKEYEEQTRKKKIGDAGRGWGRSMVISR